MMTHNQFEASSTIKHQELYNASACEAGCHPALPPERSYCAVAALGAHFQGWCAPKPKIPADCRTPKKRLEDSAKLAAAHAAHAAVQAARYAKDSVNRNLELLSGTRITEAHHSYVLALIELAEKYILENILNEHEMSILMDRLQAQQFRKSKTPIQDQLRLMAHHQSCIPHWWTERDVRQAICDGEGMYRPTYVLRVVPFLRLGDAVKFVVANLEVLTGHTFSNKEECAVAIFNPDEEVVESEYDSDYCDYEYATDNCDSENSDDEWNALRLIGKA